MASKADKSERFVVIVARQPGGNWARVVAGTLIEQTADRATLRDARQALYYARESGGEFGLAVHGPRGEGRITAQVSRVEVVGVGLVLDCTEAAIAAWRNAPVYAGK